MLHRRFVRQCEKWRKSKGGCIIFVTDNSGVCALLSWSSRRLRRVVKSTLAAENLALIGRLDTAIFVRQLLTELLYQRIDYRIPILCFIDNNDVSVELKSKNDVTEKRLRLEIHLIREAKMYFDFFTYKI